MPTCYVRQSVAKNIYISPPRLRMIWVILICLSAPYTSACSRADDQPTGAPQRNPALPEVGSAGHFVDVAQAAGILARQDLPGQDIHTIVESLGAGAAFVDLDGDAFLDLIVVGGTNYPTPEGEAPGGDGLHLYRNLSTGVFEDITHSSGLPAEATATAVVTGDVDGDGDEDIYLVDRGPNRLFRNKGGMVFKEITSRAGVDDPSYGVGAVFFDMDGDADLDLYVANYLEYEEQGTPYYAPDGYPGPLSYRAQTDRLYRNRGDGRFADVSESTGVLSRTGRAMSLGAADIDVDGDIDLFVANDAEANFLLINDGSGSFEERAFAAGVALGADGNATSAMAVSIADINGDALPDIAVSDSHFGALYVQLEAGLFQDIVMSSGVAAHSGRYVTWGQLLIDYDNDGDKDLFSANGGLRHLTSWEDQLLRNEGRSTFVDVSAELGPVFEQRWIGRSALSVDYDNDGDMDILLTGPDGLHLLRNDPVVHNGWIKIDLGGVRGARGSRVTVEAGGRRWVAEYGFCSGYLGQCDGRVHVGLGAGVQELDRVHVQFPDGSYKELEQVAVNQILHLSREP